MPSLNTSSPQRYAELIRDEPQGSRIEELIQAFLGEFGHTAALRVELANAYYSLVGHDWKHELILGTG